MSATPYDRIQSNLKILIQGLGRDSYDDVATGYKALYEIGPSALTEIEAKISEADLSTVKYPYQITFIGTLASLVHDIDETRSRAFLSEILQRGCDPAFAQRLKSILRFKTSDYVKYQIKALDIFESKRLSHNSKIRSKMTDRIDHVPSNDLQGIDRIYVIDQQDHQDYLGKYTPIFAVVTLVWMNFLSERNPISWLVRLGVEHTFYHEIGHHVHKHSGGQVPKQEREANRYAARLLKRSHPRAMLAFIPLSKALRPLCRKFGY